MYVISKENFSKDVFFGLQKIFIRKVTEVIISKIAMAGIDAKLKYINMAK